MDTNTNTQTAIFGGGCFWCVEAVFQRLIGVVKVTSGYSGGQMEKPAYEDVSQGSTGHAEVISIEFDPSQISFIDLLNVFFASHDPTTLNKQGSDVGTQYRSAIYYTNLDQKTVAENYIKQLEQDKVFNEPIVTEIKPAEKFYPAEKYHQNFYENNRDYPYCQFVIDPKITKLRQKFSHLLKPDA